MGTDGSGGRASAREALADVDVPPVDDQIVEVEVAGRLFALCRSAGALHAFEHRCPHAGSRLIGGQVRNGVVQCPLHGARFELASGRCVNSGWTCRPLKTYPVRESGGRAWIDISA
ncbi:MAG TPA: Rieske (2Fe-2S) protein [Vicinamibacterales bacterium]|nr:Rieske (2Fe-2S) protein [Vicinamibacterales bacterium]